MRLVPLLLALLLAAPALAQHHGHHGASPYAAEAGRTLKALSEADIAGLLEGRGMGFALAAELNSYPGPLHVLELAEGLALTPEQRARTEAAMATMREEAVALGAELVEAERRLDALFAEGRATPEEVDRTTAEAAALRGRIRAAHLKAHVAMREVLSPEQVAAYDRLRGYAD